MSRKLLTLIVSAIVLLLPQIALAEFTVNFDYRHDDAATTPFFSGSANGNLARATLEAAGDFFEGILDDNLLDITPGGSNSWSMVYRDPTTGNSASLSNPTVATRSMTIFVGARDLGGSTLGMAGPGGWSASGNAAWFDRIRARGQGDVEGNDAVDFGPWGGQLAIDVDSAWNFDHTKDEFSGQSDLYSVILHELGHIFGIGIADSWHSQINASNKFIGPKAVAEHGGPVDMQSGGAHWAEGTNSNVYPNGSSQEAAMDPSITVGDRKFFTDLDVAGMQDMGWTLVPEPSTFVLAGFGFVLLVVYRRRRQKAA